jgi:hypothetical protein
MTGNGRLEGKFLAQIFARSCHQQCKSARGEPTSTTRGLLTIHHTLAMVHPDAVKVSLHRV